MSRMNYHRNTQPHPAILPTGEVWKIKFDAWPWESASPASVARGPVESASAEQRQRLRALGVPEGEWPWTRVQASFILSALQCLEGSGVTPGRIAASERITDEAARRRYLCRCRRAVNEASREAQRVLAPVVSSSRTIAHCKTIVSGVFTSLREMIDERLDQTALRATV